MDGQVDRTQLYHARVRAMWQSTRVDPAVESAVGAKAKPGRAVRDGCDGVDRGDQFIWARHPECVPDDACSGMF